MPPRSSTDRFWDSVVQSGGCWIWIGGNNGSAGYGKFYDGEQMVYAHRYSYELAKGPIGVGLDLDHLCCNTWCVNPEHLEAVSRKENIQRRYDHITHCPNGHAYEPSNRCQIPKGRRGRGWCKICMAERNIKRYHARKLAAAT